MHINADAFLGMFRSGLENILGTEYTAEYRETS
jgi:hypothetical protein